MPETLKAALPEPTSEANGTAKPDLELIGSYVAQKRIEAKHNQRQAAGQIAEALGKSPDVSAVSRAEHGTNTAVLKALAQRYAPDILPNAELEGVMPWDVFATLRVRAERARQASTFEAELVHGANGANGVAPPEGNPFADATALQAKIGTAAANGLPADA